MARTRRKRRLFALLVILLFLLLFRLNPFLAGVLPGGGRWQDDPRPDAHRQGVLEVLIFRAEDRQPVQNVAGMRCCRVCVSIAAELFPGQRYAPFVGARTMNCHV